jgi:hypothetical protein
MRPSKTQAMGRSATRATTAASASPMTSRSISRSMRRGPFTTKVHAPGSVRSNAGDGSRSPPRTSHRCACWGTATGGVPPFNLSPRCPNRLPGTERTTVCRRDRAGLRARRQLRRDDMRRLRGWGREQPVRVAPHVQTGFFRLASDVGRCVRRRIDHADAGRRLSVGAGIDHANAGRQLSVGAGIGPRRRTAPERRGRYRSANAGRRLSVGAGIDPPTPDGA